MRSTSSIERTLCTNHEALAALGTETASAAAAAAVTEMLQKRVACGPAVSAAAAAAVTDEQVSQSALYVYLRLFSHL